MAPVNTVGEQSPAVAGFCPPSYDGLANSFGTLLVRSTNLNDFANPVPRWSQLGWSGAAPELRKAKAIATKIYSMPSSSLKSTPLPSPYYGYQEFETIRGTTTSRGCYQD